MSNSNVHVVPERLRARDRDRGLRPFAAPALLLCGVIALGCSGVARPANLPELHPCEIEVTLDGAPLPGAQVLLSAEGMPWSIGGMTDEAGVAKVYTHGQFSGAPAGSFKVTIVKEVIEEIPNPNHNPEIDNQPTFTKVKQLLDPTFASAKTTPAELAVAKGGAGRHVFVVTAAPAPSPKL